MRQYIMIKAGIVRSRFPSILAVFFLFPFSLMGMTHPPLKKIDTVYFNANSIKEFKESEQLIINSMNSFPNHPGLTWRLARNYFRIAKRTLHEEEKIKLFKQCIKNAEKGISLDKNSAENIYFFGLCLGNLSLQKGILSSLSNRDTLRKTMEKAVEINPTVEHAGPHRFLGVFYSVLPFFLGGDSEKAMHHLESATNLAPDHADNYFYLGEAYFKKELYLKSNQALERFLELAKTVKNDPDLPEQIEEANDLLRRIKIYQNND